MNTTTQQTEVYLGQKVMWNERKCIVTNACIAAGKFIQVSPVGNGNFPAKYYKVRPDEVIPYIKPATILDLIKAGENIALATPYEKKYNVQDAPGYYDGQIKEKGDAARVYCLYAINEKDNIGMVYSYTAWGAIYDEIKPLDRLIPYIK